MSNKDFDIIIESGKTERHYWANLWHYRELFYILAWRDIAVQYKQTVIGILWAVLRPVLTMVIFTVVFSKIANLPSEGVPYPVFVFAAMLPWTFFSTAFSSSSNSLVSNANLIGKIYFPRLIIPAASIIVAVVDFLISFVILIALMFWYDFFPTWHMLTLPFFLLLGFFAAFGAGLFITSLNVKYRDFRIVIPFIVQLGLYISPVAFSTTLIPEKYQIFYYLNPMVAVIDGFRWAVSGGKTVLNMTEIYVSISVVIILCILGVVYFRKTEKVFADVI
ncbi:ABC transporter permease [Bathymodiolus septemdierum thioautotrophic gill symbiont]|uniref:Transport permease protein n=1 Tax=endosymbiont of Bathymodiolus septemdierum str. Myojin knoll TaxID=1303921 RepID=A0A0P0URE8_9GAMM|nr:ABC transporter permease [Bathymodiolus septemdierum thioautotrophic gill symbiont]BAS67688.1 lipopolysaccharide transport system permease [endosymbiont of Bathymodiolus septemdierum str. Myojin knoll]